MWLPVLTHKEPSVICALLLVLNLASCQGGAVSSQPTREQAREHSRQETTPTPAPSPAPTPETSPPATQEEIAAEAVREGYRTHRGRYTNYEYGFSLLIPEGYIGIMNPEPNPVHGFWIILSRLPKAEINVYANYDAMNYASLDEAVNAQLRYVEREGTGIEVLRREPTTLQNLPATRVVTRYRDRASGATMIQDLIASIRSQPYRDEHGEDEIRVLYILILRTPESRYSTDKELFERVVNAWRARPLEG